MRMSAKAEYAIRAMVELATADEGALVKTEDLAKAQGIPAQFLVDILSDLRTDRLVRSHRGRDGGYELARCATDISIADVLRCIDGPLASVRDIGLGDLPYSGPTAALTDVWRALRASMRSVLETTSLADVAAESAAAIGARHIVRTVTPEEYIAAIPEIIWYLDDPVADPALVPLYFVAQTAREHVKVVLSGEGADELFGGYTIYKEPLSLKGFDRLPSTLRRLAGKVSDRIPEGTRGKSLLHRGSLTLEERYYGNARSFDDARLRAVLRDYRPEWTHTDVTEPIYARSDGWDPVARMQHIDLYTWLRGDILVKADKMTMANSLELRVPFLDNEVFKVAEALPFDEKISHGTTKYALRKALEQIVPPHVLHRKKLGFPVPIRHWLAGPEMYDWARETIEKSQTEYLLNKQPILDMLDEHRAGTVDNSRRLWTLLMFMIWHAIFVEKTLVPDITDHSYPVRL